MAAISGSSAHHGLRSFFIAEACRDPPTTQARRLPRHRLPDVTPRLCERPDPVGAELAPETRLPDAPERHPRILRRHAVAVDADRPRDELPGHLVREPIAPR